MADHSARIAEIQEILRTGASTVAIDGTTVTYDLDALRRELRLLMAGDDTQKNRRPTCGTIFLGGF